MHESTLMLAVVGALGILIWYRWSRRRLGDCPGHGSDAPGSEPGRTEGPGAQFAVDPVCGMRVRRADAVHTAEHEGRVHFFCSDACRMAFDVEPERYTAGPRSPARG